MDLPEDPDENTLRKIGRTKLPIHSSFSVHFQEYIKATGSGLC